MGERVTKDYRALFLPIVLGLGGWLLAGCAGKVPEASEPAAGAAPARDLLRSLPYAGSVPLAADQPVARGVVVHDRQQAQEGWNLFTPRDQRRAYLIDNEGRTVHSWSAEVSDGAGWQHVEVDQQGDLFVIIKGQALLRLGWNSQLRWRLEGRYHHDVAPTPSGDVWAAVRRAEVVSLAGRRLPVITDSLVRLSATGETLQEIPLLPLLGDSVLPWRTDLIVEMTAQYGDPLAALAHLQPGKAPDLFHLNSIELLGGAGAALGAADDLLISVRELDEVVVLDAQSGELRWRWGRGKLDAQHHPTMTARGSMLIFDNGRRRGWSRALEIDPTNGGIVWQYRGSEEAALYSHSRGAAQRLANGNTLITESDAGRAFEVTAAGEVVWEFFCPVITEKPDGSRQRAAMYRLKRLTPSSHPQIAARLATAARAAH